MLFKLRNLNKSFQAFANGTTIVIENGPGTATEYASSASQWIQEGYESQIIGTTAEVKECVVCSNPYGPMRRDPGSGHHICSQCDTASQKQHQRPIHRGQKPKPAVVSFTIILVHLILKLLVFTISAIRSAAYRCYVCQLPNK